jgi:hypothetical protein
LVTAHVFKWQNGNRWLIWERWIGKATTCAAAYEVNAYWSVDILERLLADVLKLQIEPSAKVIAHRPRDSHPTRRSNTFDPRRYVHPIAKHISVLDNYVPEIDPDAQLDRPFLG